MNHRHWKQVIAATAITMIATAGTALAMPAGFGSWGDAVRVADIPGTDPTFNTPGLDGCPFVSRDDKTFYMAAVRDGGVSPR